MVYVQCQGRDSQTLLHEQKTELSLSFGLKMVIDDNINVEIQHRKRELVHSLGLVQRIKISAGNLICMKMNSQTDSYYTR